MNPSVKKTIEDRIAKLDADCLYNIRQIKFLAQRLEDLKLVLQNDIDETIGLKSFLYEQEQLPPQPNQVVVAGPLRPVEVDGCKFHTSPDLPQHTNVIVG